jgi:hypothetical protein
VIRTAHVGLLALTCLVAGCTVDQPIPLEKDPEFAALGKPLSEDARWTPQRAPLLAVAPVRTAYMQAGPAKTADDEDLPYSWDKPPLDTTKLQKRLARIASWSLYGNEREVPLVDHAALGADSSRERVCEEADRLGAQLILQLDVTHARVAWVRRDGIWWWGNLALFWIAGVVPVVFIPDEIFQVDLQAELAVIHARSGKVLLQSPISGRYERSLNDAQRGFTITGLFWLDPYFLNAESGDYRPAYDMLLPHALKDLGRAAATELRRALPEVLQAPKHRKLLQEGTETSARTYAIVIGHNGPRAVEPRPPLRHAETDAEALAAALTESQTVKPEHLRLLVNEDATPDRVRGALDELGPLLLKRDRLLVYFAGYGRTNDAGKPYLVLGKQNLPVATLSAECARTTVELGNGPQIVFVLDTSFGALARGRNYRSAKDPGGPAPDARSYLSSLGRKALRWTVIAAAGPNETAFEIDSRAEESRHGFFSQRLLSGLKGEADTSPKDGVVRSDELYDYLLERVPEDVRPFEETEQTPDRRGTEEPAVVGHVR